MNLDNWTTAPLGQLLFRNERTVPIDPTEEYREVTVRLWGKGVILRGIVSGSSISADRRVQVSTNQFIISKIDARNGAMGLVPPELNGAVVSNDFPSFAPDATRLLPEFLGWLSKTKPFVEACHRASEGTTNRVRLKDDKFNVISIPLPPVEEQRRIVARLDWLSEKITAAVDLHNRVSLEADSLVRSLGDQAYSVMAAQYGLLTLETACKSITDGDHLTPRFADTGVAFIFVGNVSRGHLHFDGCKFVDPDYYAAITNARKPQMGDILYSAVGATLGVPAIIDSEREFCFQRHIAIIRPDLAKVRPKFLWHILRSSTVFNAAWNATTGTAQPTIPLRAIRSLKVPIPPLDTQDAIILRLDRRGAMIASGDEVRKRVGIEIQALIPSILDRAFRGEL